MYLVTGGSGFCGSEIVRHLREKGERVRVLDIEPFIEKIDGVEVVEADIRDAAAVSKACVGVERIIHAAAKVPISKAGRLFREVNVLGTRNVLEGALRNRVQKVVCVSSSSVQILNPSPVDEYDPYRPVGPYARSKVEAEIACKEYIGKGLNVDIVRPRTVLGEGRLGIFQILFDWVADGKNIYIIGKGNNKLQFLHVKDLASCCYLASRQNGSHIYNIGAKSFSTLREDLQFLLDYATTGSRIVSLPIWLTVAALNFLEVLHLSPLTSWHYLTYYRDDYFTNARAMEILNWQPHYGNREILRISYDWYRLHGKELSRRYGSTHTKSLKQGILRVLKMLS